jgi:hypothetical protein
MKAARGNMFANSIRSRAAGAVITSVLVSAGVVFAQEAVSRVTPQDERPAPGKSLSADRREAATELAARATAIVDGLAADAASRGMHPGWRQALLERLLALRRAELDYVGQQATSFEMVSAAVEEVTRDGTHLIGDPNRDLTFLPITPCRYIDTRNVAGKISGVRGYNADLAGSAYGGSGACGLPAAFQVSNASQIAALVLNVTAVDTSSAGAPGFLAVKPSAASPTTSLLNWHVAGTGVQVANQGVVALDQASGTEFVIETSGAVHVIVDVFGAFVEPAASFLEPFHSRTSVTVPSPGFGSLTATCQAGYAMTGGGCNASGTNHYISSSSPGGTASWACSSRNFNIFGGPALELSAEVFCVRVPGR